MATKQDKASTAWAEVGNEIMSRVLQAVDLNIGCCFFKKLAVENAAVQLAAWLVYKQLKCSYSFVSPLK